ncbi:MAG: phosphate transport system regulatory protein PhoU, partial [Planctomycetota bacterium]
TAVKVHLSRVREMDPIVRRMLRQAVQAYGTQETEIARSVFSEEEAVDALYGEVISGIVAEAARAPTNMPAVLDVLSVAKNLERIADHATNIAEDVLFVTTGEIVRHQPRDEV